MLGMSRPADLTLALRVSASRRSYELDGHGITYRDVVCVLWDALADFLYRAFIDALHMPALRGSYEKMTKRTKLDQAKSTFFSTHRNWCI